MNYVYPPVTLLPYPEEPTRIMLLADIQHLIEKSRDGGDEEDSDE